MKEIAVESPLHRDVRERDTTVECPECRQPARKDEYPIARFPLSPQARVNLGPFFGRASCENPDCHVHKNDQFISWSYGVTAS